MILFSVLNLVAVAAAAADGLLEIIMFDLSEIESGFRCHRWPLLPSIILVILSTKVFEKTSRSITL